MSRSVPFHEALRIAVEARGLALERISAHLHARGHTISIATLSYWQSGRSLPGRPASLRALGALESILDVPRGHLAGLLPGPPPAAAEPITPLALAEVLPATERLDRIVADLGLTWDERLVPVSVHIRWFVDEHQQASHLQCRETLQATDRVDSYVVGAEHQYADVDVALTAMTGCSVRRIVTRRADSACVAELELPPLRRHDCHVIEYEVAYSWPDGTRLPASRCVMGATSPVRDAYLEVNFSPGARPTDLCFAEGRLPDLHRRSVPGTARTVSAHRAEFGPGMLGYEWTTPAEPAGSD